MLEYALKHKKTIDAMTENKELKLRQYEMHAQEWMLAEGLCKVLKVHVTLSHIYSLHTEWHAYELHRS
jgi:hypothetical protein